MGVLAGLSLLCILVVIHELGHFLVAKLMGVRVLTFSVGFGPKLLKFNRGGTEYCLSAIPLGGYVKMLGESPEETLSEEEQKKSFLGQRVWKKSLIAFAGPFFNLALPIFLFFGILIGAQKVPLPVIGEVLSGKAASIAGLESGDEILKINNQSITTFGELVQKVSQSPNQVLEFEIMRHGSTKRLQVTPDADIDPNPLHKDQKIGRIGVALASPPATKTIQVGFKEALKGAFEHTWSLIEVTLSSLWMLVTLQVSPKELGGPLMIIGAASQAATQGLAYYLQLMALISVNLGLLNLLPIPVLDGGHLLFFGIEALTRRPISSRIRQVVTQVGFFLLISLMVLALFNDVARLLN